MKVIGLLDWIDNIHFGLLNEEEETMRNICCAIIIVSLLISLQLIGFAASSVEGFMGVPWGSSREQVDKAMAEQGFIRIAKPDWCSTVSSNPLCDPGLVNYDGQFGGERSEIRFVFQNKELYRGWIDLTAARSPYLRDQVNTYTRIKALLTDKYGSPATNDKTIRPNGWGEAFRASWSLTSGEAGDQIEIILLMEGVFLYDVKRPQSGNVEVFYINRSLERRLKYSNI